MGGLVQGYDAPIANQYDINQSLTGMLISFTVFYNESRVTLHRQRHLFAKYINTSGI